MINVVLVEKQTKYGSEYIYPIDEQAKNICKALGGQKTLTPTNIKDFKKLGFIFKQCVILRGEPLEVGEL